MEKSNKIWVFKGEQKKFLDEKFGFSDKEKVEIFVWQNFDRRLGFSESEEAIQFLINFLNSTYTVLFPKIELIENEEYLKKNVYNLKGISFWNKKELVKERYREWYSYIQQEKKNRLLKKYSKELTETRKPKILEWFVKNKYTEKFHTFINANNIEYVIWAYSDFGIYFYHIPNSDFISNRIKDLCAESKYEYCQVDNMMEIPHH
jgi:hypothetical protein